MPDPLQILRDLYKRRAQDADASAVRARESFGDPLPPHMVDMGPDLPPVARAPMFRPQTEAWGGQEFANGVDQFLTAIPEMRGRSPKIQHGPAEGIFQILRANGFSDNGYGLSTLLGTTDRKTKAMTINPRLVPQWRTGTPNVPAENDFFDTLGHEMGHVVNISHGDPDMTQAQQLSGEVFRPALDALRRVKK